MGNENLWYSFAALFALAGLIHLVKALKKTGGKRNAGFALAGASVIWGATALAFRFIGVYPAGLIALGAIGCMLLAAVWSGKV